MEDAAGSRKGQTTYSITTRMGRDGRLIRQAAKLAPDGEWDVTVDFEEVGGELQPVRLEIQPGLFETGISQGVLTARLLRGLKLGALVDAFRKKQLGELAAQELFFGRRGGLRYKLPPPHNRTGPRGLGEDFYQDVARLYVRALKAAPRRPIEWMSQHYPGYRKGNVRDWVFQARRKGYLSSVGQGHAGGRPTSKLRRALRATDRASEAKTPRAKQPRTRSTARGRRKGGPR